MCVTLGRAGNSEVVLLSLALAIKADDAAERRSLRMLQGREVIEGDITTPPGTEFSSVPNRTLPPTTSPPTRVGYDVLVPMNHDNGL